MNLTPTDLAAWREYESANRKAKFEYYRHPLALPWVPAHHTCLCCEVWTVEVGVCRSCQARDPEWAALADDAVEIAARRAMSRQAS